MEDLRETRRVAGKLSEEEARAIDSSCRTAEMSRSVEAKLSGWLRSEYSNRLEADGLKPSRPIVKSAPLAHLGVWPLLGIVFGVGAGLAWPALLGVAAGLAGYATETARLSARGARRYGVGE